MISELLII